MGEAASGGEGGNGGKGELDRSGWTYRMTLRLGGLLRFTERKERMERCKTKKMWCSLQRSSGLSAEEKKHKGGKKNDGRRKKKNEDSSARNCRWQPPFVGRFGRGWGQSVERSRTGGKEREGGSSKEGG